MKNLIYGYADPDDGLIRYIGQSSRGMDRPSDLSAHRRHYCGSWLKSLGRPPMIRVLHVLPDDAGQKELNASERFYIAFFRVMISMFSLPKRLTNLTDGGNGRVFGRVKTKAELSNISASLKKNWATVPPEKRRRALGSTRSEESRARISAALVGRKLSQKHRAAIVRALTGNPRCVAGSLGNSNAAGSMRSPALRALWSAQRKADKAWHRRTVLSRRKNAGHLPAIRINLMEAR